jgi:hypothetical protein
MAKETWSKPARLPTLDEIVERMPPDFGDHQRAWKILGLGPTAAIPNPTRPPYDDFITWCNKLLKSVSLGANRISLKERRKRVEATRRILSAIRTVSDITRTDWDEIELRKYAIDGVVDAAGSYTKWETRPNGPLSQDAARRYLERLRSGNLKRKYRQTRGARPQPSMAQRRLGDTLHASTTSRNSICNDFFTEVVDKSGVLHKYHFTALDTSDEGNSLWLALS